MAQSDQKATQEYETETRELPGKKKEDNILSPMTTIDLPSSQIILYIQIYLYTKQIGKKLSWCFVCIAASTLQLKIKYSESSV